MIVTRSFEEMFDFPIVSVLFTEDLAAAVALLGLIISSARSVESMAFRLASPPAVVFGRDKAGDLFILRFASPIAATLPI